MEEKVIVTRHPGLVEYFISIGLANDDTPVLANVYNIEQIAGKVVLGVLPNKLAQYAKYIVEVPLKLTQEHRGVHLTLGQIQKLVDGDIRVYKIIPIPFGLLEKS